MVQKAIVEHRGCGYGCFTTLAILIVAALLIAVLPYVGAVAAGAGLYFLMRYIWRQYVQQRPDVSFVQWGMKFAPIARKSWQRCSAAPWPLPSWSPLPQVQG